MAEFHYRSVNFSFSDKGKGIAVVMLHGFLENRFMWSEFSDYLPKAYRKISIDLPGHGDSENLGYIHTMEDMAAMVKALLDHLKIKKFFCVGHSMGGYVSLALAEKYPDQIRGMVLMNSTSRADSEAKKINRDRAVALAKKAHKSYIRLSIPNLFRPKNRKLFSKELKEVKKQALKTSKQSVIAALEGMKIRPDREVLLHFSPYPVMLVAGKADPILNFEDLQEQMQAEKVTGLVTENGHMSHIEDKDLLFKALKKFIQKN